MANITQEFLEQALGLPVEKFEVNSGSDVGDGFTSLLYTVDVTLLTPHGEKEVRHILVKCYPAHPFRQQYVTQSNYFQKELSVYNQLIPELIEFQKNDDTPHPQTNNQSIISPPFPEFIYGRAVDYKSLSESDSKICTDPLTNCILMPDLRKNGNYKLVDRRIGFDLDHCRIVVPALAKVHALSWAYKKRTNLDSLARKFTFLNDGAFYDNLDDQTFSDMYDDSASNFKGVIQTCVTDPEEKVKLLSSIDRARSTIMDVAALYFSDKRTPSSPSINKDNVMRVSGEVNDNEEPWLVCTHGDTNSNNMMFRYDEKTGKPIQVMLIDLQLMREGDPMTDLEYSLYTSTTSTFRQENLTDLLKLYVETFLQVCEQLKVVPLPGFQLAEVQRRFHRAKAFGFAMAFMCLPMFMNDPRDAVDMEKIPEGTSSDDLAKVISESVTNVAKNKSFQTRALELVRELYGEGVI